MTSPDDAASDWNLAPEPVVGGAGQPGDPDRAGPAASSRLRSWVLALAAGLTAGLFAWAVGEATMIPETGAGTRGGGRRLLPSVLATRNAMVSFGILGGALGLGLGLAGGSLRRSAGRAGLAGVTGLVLGALAGVGGARLTLPGYYEHLKVNDLTNSLVVHGATWTAIGAAAGLAFGLGLGGWGRTLRCLLGGAGAALLGAVIYEFGGSVLFPLAMTDRPLSKTWETRLLARLIVALLAAAGAVLLVDWGAGEGGREANDAA